VEFWKKGPVKSLLVPPAFVLLTAILLLQTNWIPLPAALVTFFFYAVMATGILLAWRFHSSRVVLVLVVLLLTQRAMGFFSGIQVLPDSAPGRIAFELTSFLLPLNFLLFSLLPERGLGLPAVIPRLLAIFMESVFVAVLCRPEQTNSFSFLHHALLKTQWFSWTAMPQLSVLSFLVTAVLLFIRLLEHRKAVESGLFWALIASFLAFQSGGAGQVSRAYTATAGLLLLVAIVETSYSMAYHDELTGIPARRAFNEALLGLPELYSIAIVDIDHFKQFNDTYGHDTGDQVLRLVASKLAAITGGGKAYRCGGEEFAIIFAGMSLAEVMPHLEQVRENIENAGFRLRGGERRATARKTDRRRASIRKGRLTRAPARVAPKTRGTISVTVSIGVAEPNAKIRDLEKAIDAADQALYRAKANGRNRVEMATASRP
jgi:diguanylate cyclase (GGDEF)-like protein